MAQRRKQKKSAKKKKAPARKAAKKKTSPMRKAAPKPQVTGVIVRVAPDLDARLKMLATNMSKTMEELIAQALAEFAETWEDHLRTVAALREDEGRIHLSVPKE